MTAKNSLCFILITIYLTGCRSTQEQVKSEDGKRVIIGYVPGFRGELDEKTINANKLTHINYAFVDVKDSMAWLTNIETDSINFRRLNNLKKDNPDLKIIISIGGWAWSENFSDAVLTESSRNKFATSSVAIVDQYNLDGVDIDWEYPGMRGEDNVFRPEDKQTFTLMFKAIREELDKLALKTGKTYALTTALPSFPRLFEVTEMSKVAEYIDYVNIMAYDFYVSGDTAGHHSNLFASENYEREDSGDKAYTLYRKEGVPAEKLVLGIPFYGYEWQTTSRDPQAHTFPDTGSTASFERVQTLLAKKDQLKVEQGWNESALSPYISYEENGETYVVYYENSRSVSYKLDFVNQLDLAGIAIWALGYEGNNRELWDVINRKLTPSQN
jgi:chitinase